MGEDWTKIRELREGAHEARREADLAEAHAARLEALAYVVEYRMLSGREDVSPTRVGALLGYAFANRDRAEKYEAMAGVQS